MKYAYIVVFILPLCLFTSILSAQDWTNTKSTSRILHVCSSGIRNNACDTSKQKLGNANRRLPLLPDDGRVNTDYMSHIESMIATNFILPRGVYNDLSAIIAIKLSRDGNVSGQDFEKRSGNSNFDMTAMHAIKAAAPFGSPPREYTGVSIKVIFYP